METLLKLGIDPLAIAVYITNSGLILVVLFYFLYKPVLRVIDERRAKIADSLEEARVIQEEFQKKLVESEQLRQQIENQLKDDLEKLRKYTEEKRAELLAEMDKTRQEMLAKTQKEIEERKASLIEEVEADLKKLMTRIILHIVENKVPQEVISESVDSSWQSYNHKK